MARTTRQTDPNGRILWVGEGAVRQDGNLPLYRCNTCGGDVVWATSCRTGRKYLVDVSRGYQGQLFYVKRAAHDCVARTALIDSYATVAEHEQAVREWTERCSQAQVDHAAGRITRDDLIAVFEDAPTHPDQNKENDR